MSLKVAILGATGLVGREIADTLAERGFPPEQIVALASRASQGREVSLGDRTLRTQDAENFDWGEADVCFLAVGERPARRWGPKVAASGCIVIDVSGAFRLDPDTPLIAPEVNPELLEDWRSRRIVAVPGAAAAQIAAVLKPLQQAAGLRGVTATVLLSASEYGQPAMDELWTQTKGIYVNQPAEPKEFVKQIAFNLIPQAGDFLDDGATDAEANLRGELRKLLGENVEVASTCILAPVFVGHAAAVHVELEHALEPAAARALLRESPGLMVVDNAREDALVTPLESVGEWATFVSRIRRHEAIANGLAMWIVSDNLRKGLALNAVQLAEMLHARGAFAEALHSPR